MLLLMLHTLQSALSGFILKMKVCSSVSKHIKIVYNMKGGKDKTNRKINETRKSKDNLRNRKETI